MSEQARIPPHWSMAPLGDLVLDRVENREPAPREHIRYIDISAIDNRAKRVTGATELVGASAPTRARQWVQTGDVLVSLTRPNLNAVALVDHGLDGCVASTGFDVLRPLEIEPRYIHYFAQSDAFVQPLASLVQGVVYPAVRPRDVRRQQIPVPPLREQVCIADALDDHFTRLDAAEAALKRAQARLKRFRASVLQAAVTGRLVPTEAEIARREGRSYEPASALLERVLAERRKRFEASGKRGKSVEPAAPDVASLLELPEGWCWATVGTLKVYSIYGPRFAADRYASEGPAVLRTSDITPSGRINLNTAPRIRLTSEELDRFRVCPGDLLVTRSGSVGTVAVYDDTVAAIPGAYLLHYRFDPLIVDPWYVLAVLRSSKGQRTLRGGAGGVGRPNLNAPTVEQICVPVPPILEQRRIVEAIDEMLAKEEHISGSLAGTARRTATLRRTVLALAFAGRLVDPDPSDEPASALLDRIRASPAQTVSNASPKPRRVPRRPRTTT